MPLSEHEQRQLEQIEQALYRENRRLGRLVRSSDPRVHYRRRVVQAASGFVVGAGMVAAGVILSQSWHAWLAIAGFVVMLLCGVWALSSWRHMAGVNLGVAGRGAPPGGGVWALSSWRHMAGVNLGVAGRGAPPGGRRKRRGGNRGRAGKGAMMERFDERWRRRQERGDR